MLSYGEGWGPVIAEQAATGELPVVPFPCRGPFNRYTGCIGARRCRATGVLTCILGRWPEERSSNSSTRDGESPSLAEPADGRTEPTDRDHVPGRRREVVEVDFPTRLQRGPAVAGRAAAVRPTAELRPTTTPLHPVKAMLSPVQATQRQVIGVVQSEPRLWQQISRQVASAGFEPIWLPTDADANAALDSEVPPAALLIGSRRGEQAGKTGLVDLAAKRDIPILNLPNARDQAGLISATRMAVLWLTVTLRKSA